MNIKDIFEKPIDREIRGVIKVDKGIGTNDSEITYRESIEKQELEEYVVTRELQKHFATFFSNYKKGIIGETEKIGVWISGFFGSGKSHFLKNLAYLLDSNKTVAGKRAIDYFKEGNKIKDDMVLADMELASKTPTDVILFNIDSKSDGRGKDTEDSLVHVFLKVFNEMQGFCSEPHVADLERKLVDEGKYEEFIRVFEESGCVWKEERNSPIFIQDELVDALTTVGFMSEDAARNLCVMASDPNYNISIEEFAKLVKAYLDKKGKKQHIVFFVDEIGQYIADNSKLMLNLQTITERLGDICKGRAWIVVTSQQDIDSVSKTIKGVDFSKIQGRFDTRLSLSSANADEVIKKRILAKNESGTQSLKVLFDLKATALKNIISFNDGIEKKLYADADNFAEVYPFIPYQFNLTGSMLTAIRTYSSSGKHMADGERSLLAVFKESAMKIKDLELGALIPFNMFYEPIKEFIDHSHSIVIKRAIDNEYVNPEGKENCFNVEVLKTLFMIKYVKEIKANVDNITSLMVSDINEDRLELKNKVEDALNVLVRQTLVQKMGTTYVFLTNEEQEINIAIERTPVEPSEKTHKIAELVFEKIYETNKYKLPQMNGRYSFGFNQIVDDMPFKNNQNYPISLRILTPNGDNPDDSTTLRLMSGQENSVLVVLPEDRTFIDEITLALQIRKYMNGGNSEGIKKYEAIIAEKKNELRDHERNSEIFLEEALKSADIYVNGDLLKSSAKDPATRINEAIGKLVKNIYHKLSYIDTPVTASDIDNIFKPHNQLTLDGSNANPNVNAINDMYNYIFAESAKHTRISLKMIANHFMSAPYGFIEVDVQWLVAKLFKNGKLEFQVKNEFITMVKKTPQEIVKYITRKEYLETLMINIKKETEAKFKKAVKEVSKDLFNFTVSDDDSDDKIMDDFIRNSKKMKQEIELLKSKYDSGKPYPGKMILSDGIKLLNYVLQTNYTNEFFTAVYNKKDDFLDFAEDFDYVKKFFANEQVKIFDKSLHILEIYEQSKMFIADKEINSLAEKIGSVIKMSSPYNAIKDLPDLNEKFITLNVKMLANEAEKIRPDIERIRKDVFEYLESVEVQHKDALKEKFIRLFDEIREKIKTCNNLANLKNITLAAESLRDRCYNEIESDIKQPEPAPATSTSDGTVAPPPVPVIKRKRVSMRQLNMGVSVEIKNAEDVDEYVERLKQKLLNELEKDTIVRIEF